jgi:hypothetical protein
MILGGVKTPNGARKNVSISLAFYGAFVIPRVFFAYGQKVNEKTS